MEHRPKVLTTKQDLRNQDITTGSRATGCCRPSAPSLVRRVGPDRRLESVRRRAWATHAAGFRRKYPEYAAGVSAAVVLRNPSAQADNLRARLEEQQLQVQMQRTRQQIGLEVRQATISLIRPPRRSASHEAVRLAQRAAEAERREARVGVSTGYDVILRERDFLTARQADVARAPRTPRRCRFRSRHGCDVDATASSWSTRCGEAAARLRVGGAERLAPGPVDRG